MGKPPALWVARLAPLEPLLFSPLRRSGPGPDTHPEQGLPTVETTAEYARCRDRVNFGKAPVRIATERPPADNPAAAP
jgi:hypothetical protein